MALGKKEKRLSGNFSASAGMPLTAAEIALVESIFGDEINTAIVRKRVSDQGDTIAYVGRRDKRNIFFHKGFSQVEDFTQSNAVNFGIFIHEMTHVWQHQRGFFRAWRAARRDRLRSYDYKLSAAARFDKYGIEQQAQIIQHYACRFLHASQAGNSLTEDEALLQKVVEERFPRARETRLALTAERIRLMQEQAYWSNRGTPQSPQGLPRP